MSIGLTLTLTDICTSTYLAANFLADDFYDGITLDPTCITAKTVTNATASSVFYPNAVIDYCAVTFKYSHNGLDDSVLLTYWIPALAKFQNRYLSTGGGGYAINSRAQSLPGGIEYGAVAGDTDGGFGILQSNAISGFLLASGTLNWRNVYMFGDNAIHEMSVIGKEFTTLIFNMTANNVTLYSYYQGCSESGREGWSQVQRFANQFDEAAIGAPAFRYAFQQIQHLYSNVVENTQATIHRLKILDGLHITDGRRAYFSYTPSSTFTDAATAHNDTSGEYGVSIQDGWNRYNDVLLTNWPDLTPYKNAGGKIIHFHGESDYSIPTASSVRSYESVREIMNPGLSYNDSVATTNEFYRLFLVPGGSHCAVNTAEPNGPWPQTNLQVLIDWVEN
ncbi:hypothetical protein BPOR_1298g00020 [Botrytis porri]|uniref:Carboxylic ester hydrolase n=1 Tax=Botrytis porri TaxID=87229 RepID=A0A4Z1KI81_9HELO|nr:hypothetical protein BPOR_1298g00020 [Botrytis porri]